MNKKRVDKPAVTTVSEMDHIKPPQKLVNEFRGNFLLLAQCKAMRIRCFLISLANGAREDAADAAATLF